MKCQTCQGKRIITKMQPNMQGPSNNRYQSAITPFVERNYQCEDCNGTGKAPDAFEINGHTVNAPGFTPETFLDFVVRAKQAQLRTTPARTPGTVMVQSGSSPAQYAVTRASCSCRGRQGHGRCYHRALIIHLADVENVSVCTLPTIGVNKKGITVRYGRTPAARPHWADIPIVGRFRGLEVA